MQALKQELISYQVNLNWDTWVINRQRLDKKAKLKTCPTKEKLSLIFCVPQFNSKY